MRSTRLPKIPVLLPALVSVFILMMPSTMAVVSQTMGNITFECPDGWQLDGPDCYLLVDVAMTLKDARDLCDKYGSDVVEIEDEMEAKSVAQMVEDHSMQWSMYWINNNLTDSDDVCGGFWSIGEPKEADRIPMAVSACKRGMWYQTDTNTRLPFVCRAAACVDGTFRCRHSGFKCISNNYVCDGVYDCEDESDESNCADQCTEYIRQSSGQLSKTYNAGQTCSWFIEGPEPGKPLSILLTSLNLETDVDCVEVWSGGPSFRTSRLQERICGDLPPPGNRMVYSHNNFLIVRITADLSEQHSGLVANWAVDLDLLPRERREEATDSWQYISSPYFDDDSSPHEYVRHYTVFTTEGSLITMEVLKNELGNGFEYDPETLIPVGDTGDFPDTYVSRSHSFTFYLNSIGRNEPVKFKAKIKKGCTVQFTRTNSYLTSPNIPPSPYPPSTRCTYLIKAPQDAQRAFQLQFVEENLADDNDTVKVYDGNSSAASMLTPSGSGMPFVSTGPEVFVEFTSSLVQSNGSFKLSYNMACPELADTSNMQRDSTSTHYQSVVILQCDQGYAFAQQDYLGQNTVAIRCGPGGKWNVSRLPTCRVINCGIPEVMANGFVSQGSGLARYGHNVTYECFQGFNMIGHSTSTCGDNSQWSNLPSCTAALCPTLSAPAEGSLTKVIGNGDNWGTIFNYSCNAGYDLIGARHTLCKDGGVWSHAAPVCTRIKCPIPEIDRATLNPASNPIEFESNLVVTCDSGYVINGTTMNSNSFPCMASGMFDVSRDMCVDKDECGEATPVCILDHEDCKNTIGHYDHYDCVCRAGYTRVGSVCKAEFGCELNASRCDLKNGRCEGESTCVCNTGYQLFSQDGVSGRHIPSPEDGLTPGDVYYLNHTCVPMTCSAPPTVANGQPLTTKTQFDFEERVSYRCDFGYRFTGNDYVTCNSSGLWDHPTPVCEAITCDPLNVSSSLVRAIHPSAPTMEGDKVLLECFSQSKGVNYNKTLFCAFDQQSQSFVLQGDSPDCPAIDCGEPQPLGGASFTVTSTELGASFTFNCLDGFTREGFSISNDNTVTCGSNGRWGFGNLTCTGARCSDPKTPGGMTQVSAQFEVNGTVVYGCLRDGFEPQPLNRTCSYDAATKQANWDSSVPECIDVEKPTFQDCPAEPIKLKLYQTVKSKHANEPTANDNSGLSFITVEPLWFKMDLQLAESVNVTYTASDSQGNQGTCSFNVVVNDPSVLPYLKCPEYVVLLVDSDTPYTFDLRNNVTADSDDVVTFDHGPEIAVGPSNVGKTVVRVTATNEFQLQRQCAFVVDIRPNVCLQTYFSADNADVTCTPSGGNLSCSAVCRNGYAYHDGQTSKDYKCVGMNEWSPSLPALACTDAVDSNYTFVIRGDYYLEGGLLDCQDGLVARLEEVVPTLPLCRNGFDSVPLYPKVQFIDVQTQNMTVEMSLRVADSVDKSSLPEAFYTGCRFGLASVPQYRQGAMSMTNVNCTNKANLQTFTVFNAQFIMGDWACETGQVVKRIDSKAMCVKCAPGSFASNDSCEACPDGQYQDSAGQEQCKQCENGVQHSVVPRTSSSQCIASCALGFTNGENFTTDAALQCTACPVDTYIDTPYTAACLPCNSSMTTSGQEGAKACIDKCAAGKYPVNNTACAPCPVGFYKDSAANVACTRCPPGKTTNVQGSADISACVDFDVPSCVHNASYSGDPLPYCVCEKGYSGKFCNVSVDSCLSDPCYNGGTCTSTGPMTFECACTSGFNGTRCEIDIVDDCTPTTCDNETFCRDGIGKADCVCPTSSLHVYTEPKCVIDRNVCTPSQCLNSATCLSSSDGLQAFTCVCLPGYTGSKCEVNIDDCKNNPNGCLYGGSCTDAVDDYTCNCGDYEGKRCEVLPNFCTQDPIFCENGLCFNDYNISSAVCVCSFPYRLGPNGRCQLIDLCTEDNRCKHNSTCNRVSPGVTRCQCQPGYNGSLCQHNIDDCASKPCVHGQCSDLVNNYECQCDNGYNGTNCDNNIDDCPTSSCVTTNTARCIDLVDDYRCVCNPGWTGKNCQDDIDECLSLPCQHGGACAQSSVPGEYNCTCIDGWTGHNCEELEQFCQPDTCESGGTCYSLQDDYFCECVGGSSGKNCSIFVNLCDKLEPCEPPSSCQKNDNAASCNCSVGYTGTSCNLIEDSCKLSPCLNGGTCVPLDVGYTCKCADGYSGVKDCAQASDPCDTVTCPAGAPCVEFMGKPVCLCGANRVKSGSTCKDVTTDFDIYFKKPAAPVRSCQPFNWTTSVLTLTFWAAPTADTDKSLVELRLGNNDLVLAVMMDSVTIGSGSPISFGNSRSFTQGRWNHFSITCTTTSLMIYLNGVKINDATHNDALPSLPKLVASYVGDEYQGYISQVMVFQRALSFIEVLNMFSGTHQPSSTDLVLTWTSYKLATNVWSRLIHDPAMTRTQRPKVCEDGQSETACDDAEPDKEPPTVSNCPGDTTVTKRRLAQVYDFFNGQQLNSNINGTVIPLGAHKLVFMARDNQNNVAFCRFIVYVKREGQMLDSSQNCGVTDGLKASYITSCGTRGQTVQCPNNGMAPLSPRILTCGKLGAYNWAMPSLQPPAIVCGAAEPLRYRIHLKLKYSIGVNCSSADINSIVTTLKEKVKKVNEAWPLLCDDASCGSANTSDVTCASRILNANVIIHAVPATLTNGAGLELTAKELVQKSTLEDSAFDMSAFYFARLLTSEVEVIAVPGCKDGYGLHQQICVMCASGSFLNGTSGKCELCPVGSFSAVDMATSCQQCPDGRTTLQRGATDCVVECPAGSAYNMSSNQCAQCPKDFYTDQTGQVYCKFCPANTDNEGPGSTSSAGCVGTCPAGTELNNTECKLCPRGKYSDGIEIDRCVDCPTGNTTDREGSTSLNSCYQTACNPGSFRNSTTNLCEVCDFGKYQPEKWQDECLSCNDSYTTNTVASTNLSQCLYYCNAGEELVSAANKSCRPCPRGKYKSNEGLAKLGTCQDCANGNTTDTIASVSALDCNIHPCSAGQKLSANGGCEDCPPDTYQEQDLPSKNTECRKCDTGKGTRGDKQTSSAQCEPVCGAGEQYDDSKKSCVACPMGTYNTGNETQRFEQCAPCRDGYVTAGEKEGANSSLACTLRNCSAGEFIDSNEDCQKCPVGEYQEKPRQYLCNKCGTNTNTSSEGSTSESDCTISCDPGEEQTPNTESDCQPCQPDFIKSSAGPGKCTQCTGNYTANAERTACNVSYCDRGFQLSETDSTCVACELGKFKALRGNATQCQPCADNTTTAGTASVSEDDCNVANCVPGFFSLNGSLPCQPCPMGTFKNSTGNEACTNCTVNRTTAGEASTSQAQCSVVVCGLGEYRAGNTCLKCGKGSFANETGRTMCMLCDTNFTTVTTGTDSADLCVPICGRGQYLNETAKECMNCSLGTYNPQSGSISMVVRQCQNCPEGNTTSTTGAVYITECDTLDCVPGSFRSTNGGCEQCPLGFYQPVKSQSTCLKCPDGLSTLVTGREKNSSCVEKCRSGYEYVMSNKTCVPCPLASYRDEAQDVRCVKCPKGQTTVSTGQSSCIPKSGYDPTIPVVTKNVTIRVTFLVLVRPCGVAGSSVGKQDIANAIIFSFTFLIRDLSIINFPGICMHDCNNVVVFLRGGCLEGLKRSKRQTSSEQLVEVVVSGVQDSVEQRDSGKSFSTKGVIERAFYDLQKIDKTLELNQVEFVEVVKAEELITCLPGNAINGTECTPCQAGTYSSQGVQCTPCAENTYQNNAGHNKCIDCPDKTFTATKGASEISQCIRRCNEANARQVYCSGSGRCVFDQSVSNGVSCVCEENYSGKDCGMKDGSTDKKTHMIAGIVAGSCAFLLVLLIVFGIVVCLRRRITKNGSTNNGSGSKDGKRLTREDDGTMSEGFANYNFPMYNPVYDNTSGVMARHSGPALMYVDPSYGGEEDVRDFYASDRSRARSRSRSYAEEWKTLPDV